MQVVFRTQFSTFDTVLAVYRQDGSGFSGLTQMDASDDAVLNGVNTLQSQVALIVGAVSTAIAGTTYSIALDGFNGQSGNATNLYTLV
ncbi:MAG TPA: hypothetical protein VFC19_38815 [Candidatus Limnocylindrales bacterium]|nr:hypothetical protein [Candidatus Limnocylindrales bacterium]